MTHPEPAPSTWVLARPYVFDIAGPFVAYALVHALGAPGFWAMTAAGTAAALSAVINSLRRKGFDAVGLLVLLEIIAALLIMIFVREPRLLLVRPSFYTALAAVFLLTSVLSGRPLTYAGARTIAARKGPDRLAAYERAWQFSPAFRRTHLLVTLGFAICLAVDSVLRVLIVYTASLDRAAWLSNVPHLVAMVLMVATSALAGRRFSKLVDEQMPETIQLEDA